MNEQALTIIDKSRYMSLATIDMDGSPRSTIVFCGVEDGEIMWRSNPTAIHSLNVERTGLVALSAFYEDEDSSVFKALYVATSARSIGNEKVDKESGNITFEYRALLGHYDETQSKPNRLYFKYYYPGLK
jgi:hypothetical protein